MSIIMSCNNTTYAVTRSVDPERHLKEKTMGRPLRKDVNGIDVIGSWGTNDTGDKRAGIRVEFHDGSALNSDGIIVRQRGAKTYVVSQNENVAENLTKTTNQFTCVLQADEPSAAGQMRITGYTADPELNPVYIAKMTKRVATDFDDNRYLWEMVNYEDSSGDEIRLTPIV